MTDHWQPPQRPTNAEVREVVANILRIIETSPDWWRFLKSDKPATPDKTTT